MLIHCPAGKGFLILLLSIILLSQSYSQKFDVEIKTKIEKDSYFQFHEILHIDETGIYLTYDIGSNSVRYPKMILEKYNHDFQLVFSKKLFDDPSYEIDHGLKLYDNHFLWLTSLYNRDSSEIVFYLTPVDFQGKKHQPKQISKLKVVSRTNLPYISWTFSPDSTKIVLTASNLFEQNKYGAPIFPQKFRQYICVFDLSGKVLGEKFIDEGLSTTNCEIVDYYVHNNGDVYFANRLYTKVRRKGTVDRIPDRSNYKLANDIKIFKFDILSDKIQELSLLPAQKSAKTLKIASDSKNNIVISGVLGKIEKGGGDGLFVLKLDSENQDKLFYEESKLPKSYIDVNHFNIIKDGKQAPILSNLVMTSDIVFFENDEFVVIHEGRYHGLTTRVMEDGKNYSSSDKFLTKYTKEGKIIGSQVIPQNLSAAETGYLSYYPILLSDQLYIFYNDLKDNILKDKKPNANYKAAKTGNSMGNVMAALDFKAEYSRFLVSDKKDFGSLVMVSFSKAYKNEVFLIAKDQGLVNSSYYLGKVSIQN